MLIRRKINTEASGGCFNFPQTKMKGGNKAGTKLSSFRFKEEKANVELCLSMNMQRRAREGKKKEVFFLFPELLWNLPEGFGCADVQNQLWRFGWRVADIDQNKHKQCSKKRNKQILLFQHNKCP